MNLTYTSKYITSDWYQPVTEALSRIRSVIDSIVLNNDGTMTLTIGFEPGNGNVNEYNLAAYGGYIDGVEKVYVHPSTEHTFYSSTWYKNLTSAWDWYRIGTHTITIPATSSFELKVKGMFYYGWDNDRWNSNLGCISKSATVTVTLPDFDAMVNTPDGWKKGKTYVKINDEWKECNIYCKVDSTWRRGVTF